MADMPDDPSPEEQTAFAEVRAEISARIRGLESEVARASVEAARVPDLHALHERLTRTEVADVVDGLQDSGDDEGLRELLFDLVESAVLVDRWPANRSTWLRLAVTWKPDVRTLLDAGLLTLDTQSEKPVDVVPAWRLRKRANAQARYWQQKLQKVSAPMTAGTAA
jgi:hypothetical protein